LSFFVLFLTFVSFLPKADAKVIKVFLKTTNKFDIYFCLSFLNSNPKILTQISSTAVFNSPDALWLPSFITLFSQSGCKGN